MQQKLFQNKTDDFRVNNQNHLNIECGFGLFKAVIINPTTNEVIWACSEESTGIEKSLNRLNLSDKGFAQVTINLANGYSTLIPNKLFDENQLDNYLNYNFETIDHTIADFDSLKTVEAKNCYLLFKKERDDIYQLFSNATIGHQSTSFIELNRASDSSVILEMHPTHFQLMHVRDHHFKIFNCFAYENAEDLLYYVTYALRQLKIEKETVVELSGWIDEKSTLYKKLKEYLPELKIRKATISPIKPGCIPLSELHQFNQVIRQHICA